MLSSKLLHTTFLLLFSADMLVVDSKVHGTPNRNKVASVDTGRARNEDSSNTPPRGPHFAKDTPKRVLAAVGAPAHIPCKARNLGAKSVSWIRHNDLHVLTVGSFTFTNDERFSAHRDPSSGDWVLVLRRPQPTDSGYYECSISTKPVTAISVKLEVVVPLAELLGVDSVFLDKGSTLNLTCVVRFSPTPPEFILWYHRDKGIEPVGGLFRHNSNNRQLPHSYLSDLCLFEVLFYKRPILGRLSMQVGCRAASMVVKLKSHVG
ncbi:lachesin-like [Palaemon carinicauda]|uniref:lachesin-like n=1 Tax=Palaemon carinicauda TaxID=392227 RepID=UPI0035B66EB8